MQDVPLTLTMLLRHGEQVHRRSSVLTFDGAGFKRSSFGEVGERCGRLAAGLRGLGCIDGDRVATFMWNAQEHLEAYFAVPCAGAVLHTLNIRLPDSQLVHIVNEAEDRVVLAHSTLLPRLAALADQLKTVEHYVVADDGAPVDPAVRGALGSVLGYEELLERASGDRAALEWPQLDERSAASMCYTSGTTGDPKGVVYSHRSMWLHAFGVNNFCGVTMSERDTVLIIVPQFHVNAWGYPYAAWMHGADIVMPSRYLQGEPIARMIQGAGVTLSAGVPTIWTAVAQFVEEHPETDVSSLRAVLSGGSALPRALIDRFDKLGVLMLQGWGMTETSPVCAVSQPPADADPADPLWRMKTGRIVPGVDVRIVTDAGEEAPWDGVTTGEIEVRGPWVTGGYYRSDDPQKFHDTWLRTGDIASIDDYGFLQISDRLKDVIKSGGEWISSVELENQVMSHADVMEATVVGVPDDRWGERPLAVVVRRPGSPLDADALRAWLEPRVARWWLPERWAFVDEIPKTSVGKFDKKVVRAAHAAGALDVHSAGPG